MPARPEPRRNLILAAQLLAAALLFFFLGRALVRQWQAFRATPLSVSPNWVAIVASGVLVLLAYAVLVQSWRMLLGAEGAPLSFARSARIWFVSNLWRYVPGKVWQFGVMGSMASRVSVPPVAAASAALVGTILNIAAGIAIALLLAWGALPDLGPQARTVAVALVLAAGAGILLLPVVAPAAGRLLARVAGRDFRVGMPPRRVLLMALLLNVASWILYGIAFMWFTRGVLGAAGGTTTQYIAVYAASYVVGYLVLFIPGGIGPREAVMVLLLTGLALATPKQAWLVAGASRLWLTALEIVPGLLFLAMSRDRESPPGVHS